MVTIGINIRMLARGSKTGIEEYTSELLEYMIPLQPDIRFKLFYNGFKKDNLYYPWIRRSNVELYEYRIPNRILDMSFRLGNIPKWIR